MRHIVFVNALLFLGFLLFVPLSEAGRFKTKLEINKQFRHCIFKEKRKLRVCLKERKMARREQGVSFRDDVAKARAGLQEIKAKVLDHARVTYEEDQDGNHYINLTIKLGKIQLNHFSYSPPQMHSSLHIYPAPNGSQISLHIYEEDLYRYTQYDMLSLVGRENFPMFINGIHHDTLSGIRSSINGKVVDIYADGTYDIFGGYFTVLKWGDLLEKVNKWKNDQKFLSLFPDLTGIPIPVFVKGVKIGKINLLGYGEQHLNAGILLRINFTSLKEVALLTN
ncbi:MAG: hypothetical protein ACOCUH_00265 [Bacteriovoracia bacterium]